MTTTSRLHRFLDTGDLALLDPVEPWHARPSTTPRGPSLRPAAGPAPRPPGRSAAASAPPASEDERMRLLLALLRLDGRDREALRLQLSGVGPAEAARRLGLAPDAARAVISGALDRARRLAALAARPLPGAAPAA